MLYIIPTKHGLGLEMWGTYDDLNNFYHFIAKFWNDEEKINQKGFDNRDYLISSFSYEIRKAKEGSRLKSDRNHLTYEEGSYLGVQISWVHFLFSLNALKFNMRYAETNKFDTSQILLIEFWLEKAMYSYDAVGAVNLTAFIEDAIYGGNKYIYQYMRSINLDFFQLGGGKKAFRKLPDLLKRAVYYTDEYKDYEAFLTAEAKRLNCEISDLEFNDNDFDYETLKW